MVRPVDVKAFDDYRLFVKFSTGEQGWFDVKPYLEFPFFAPLKNKDEFLRVFVNDYTVEWPSGCDIAPQELYDDCRM